MREIPVSIADFEHLIKQDCVYVDKTKYIYDVVSSPNIYYFLSRPRRFGKSLTICTLQAIFEGKKELFKGLYLEKTDWKWEKHPIVRLDFNWLKHQTTSQLRGELVSFFDRTIIEHDIKYISSNPESIFPEIIVNLYKKYNQRVVILIDEYDKPVISHLGLGADRLEIAKENKEFLKVFYDNLKPLEPYLKTVFITGVSKFSKISIFSTLNNLIELDTMPDFADFLGYTEEELRDNFHDYFEVMAEKKGITVEALYDEFKKYYNGFRFTKKEVSVYNPFSVGKALFTKEVDNYWFQSGTPSFLINLMKEKQYDISEIQNKSISLSTLKAFDIEDLDVDSLLFQTGYTTIAEMDGSRVATIRFPNEEVKQSLLENIITSFTEKKIDLPLVLKMQRKLMSDDYDEFFQHLNSSYAGIPFRIIPSLKDVDDNDKIARYEFYYHSLFYMTITLMSHYREVVMAEILSNTGIIDMALIALDRVIIFEFKVDQSAEKAINQIKDKGYVDRFRAEDKRIILIGIDFSSENRNIRDYRVEEI